MLSRASSAKDDASRILLSEAEKDEIRSQFERILADPLFLNSRRYPNFLRL